MTGLTGYVRRYEYNKKMRIWETCTILATKEFKKLTDQADYNKNVDPLVYVGRLLGSCFSGFIGVTTIVVICFSMVEKVGVSSE